MINVSNPTAPAEIGFVDTPGEARGVYVGGDRAYVAAGDAGLRVIDVKNLADPTEIGFVDTPGEAYAVYVSGDYAYVAAGDGLQVIDVGSLTEIGFFNPMGWPVSDVYVSGELAYMAAEGGGLRIIDVGDPANPIEIGFFEIQIQNAQAIYVNGDQAYVADWYGGLWVIDVGDPDDPTEIGFFNTPWEAFDVQVSGDRAYVADGGNGLWVIDVSDPTKPAEIGLADGAGEAWAVHVSGDLAYYAAGEDGLRVIDADLTEIGFIDTEAWNVYVSGNLAYVADGGLRVIDVSDPTNAMETGFFDTPGLNAAVYVSGDLVYVADWEGGLLVLRYTGPLPPPTGPGQISGRVTTAATGEPLADILAQAYRLDEGEWRPAGSAHTDAAGLYTIPDLAAGGYRVSFSDPDGVYDLEYYDGVSDSDQATTVSVAAKETTSDINATLEKVKRIDHFVYLPIITGGTVEKVK